MNKKNIIVNSKIAKDIKARFEESAINLADSLEMLLEMKDGDLDYNLDLLKDGLVKSDWDDVFYGASRIIDFALAQIHLKQFRNDRELYNQSISNKDRKELNAQLKQLKNGSAIPLKGWGKAGVSNVR